MFNKNNFMKKGILLLLSSTISCNAFAMENTKDVSGSSFSNSILNKSNSLDSRKSNIQKLFDEILKEKQHEKDPRYYNEINLKNFLDQYDGNSENISKRKKIEILKFYVKRLYSQVDEWCDSNIENKEELSEDIYKLIHNYNDKMLEWLSTQNIYKTKQLNKKLKNEARIYINEDKNIWAFIKGPTGLFGSKIEPKGLNNCHTIEFGFDKPSNYDERIFKDNIICSLRATVTFKTEPFKEYLLIDKEKQIWSDTTKYCVSLRHEQDANNREIRISPYEIKLSFHYGELDKNKGKEYIVRDLDKFLKN